MLAFTATFVPGYKGGGPIKSMLQILDALPESVKVTMLTADRDLGDSMPYPELSGRLVHHGPHEVYYVNWRDPRQWLALLRWARRNPVDLIYVNSLWSPLFAVLPLVVHHLRLLTAREVLLAPRGELSPGALGIKSKKKKAFLLVWAPLLRRLDPIWHASTEMEEREIRDVFPWARTVVQINTSGDAPRNDIMPSGQRARFVFISRISEKKNLQLVLEALQRVRAEVSFDIYGPLENADYWRTCRRLMESLPSNVRATYRGPLQPDQIQETFAQYDGFIFPTLGENFGHVIAESLSGGCPVICSRHTPWTHLLNHGGGAALDELDAGPLCAEIEAWASRTPAQRDAAKRTALSVYAEWRARQKKASAVERVLDNLPGSNQTEAPSSPRIALVTQGYQTAGGVQTVARWLAAGLRATGYDVEIFNLATSRADAHSRRLMSPGSWRRPSLMVADPLERQVTHVGGNGIELEPLRYLPRAELSTALDRFDLVQVVAGAPALALATVRSQRPVVLQVATTVASERASQLAMAGIGMAQWRGAMTRLVSRMERAALRRVDAVLVENIEMHDFASSVGQTNVVLAPPGVDTERFTPRADGWDSSGYLLSVCRLNDERKGLDRLICSYALMTSRRPTLPNLVLAGRGDLPLRLTKLINELGIAGRVTVRRDVPPSDLPSLYRGASVYLQTSYEEGLGISIIEAMASGLPVVSTETAGTRETVAHGDTGWLVNQGEGVESEIAERTISVWEDDAHAMSRRARSRAVALFSDQATLTRFLKVYVHLLGDGLGPNR